jgi:hypothetical protein
MIHLRVVYKRKYNSTIEQVLACVVPVYQVTKVNQWLKAAPVGIHGTRRPFDIFGEIKYAS